MPNWDAARTPDELAALLRECRDDNPAALVADLARGLARGVRLGEITHIEALREIQDFASQLLAQRRGYEAGLVGYTKRACPADYRGEEALRNSWVEGLERGKQARYDA